MITVDEQTISRLERVLAAPFEIDDARTLARVIGGALTSENVYAEQIPLAAEDFRDGLLMAFEERILIPVRGRGSGSSWEDRLLRFTPAEMFFMPHVARIFFENAAQTGVMDAEAAVRAVLSHHPARHVDQAVAFLKKMKPHADSCVAEGGLMVEVAKKAGITTDVHDIVDACVIGGIMSPCTRGFATQGFAWYEFHPCIYWDPQFG